MMRPVGLLCGALVAAGVMGGCGSPGSEEAVDEIVVETAPQTAQSVDATTSPRAPTSTPSEPSDADAQEPYIGPLRFEWPIGCEVIVTETVERDAETAQFVYPLFIREAGDNIEVSYGELDVIHFRDQPVSAADQAQLAALFAQPSFTVDREGGFVSVSGVDDLLRNMQAAGVIGEVPDREAFVSVIEETVLNQYWGSWVGRWVERPEVTAEVMDDVVITRVADADIAYDLRRESLTPSENGSAHLRDTTTIEGAELERFLAATRGALSGADESEAFSGVDGEKVTVVDAVLDPVTLRPTRVRFDDRSTIEIDGQVDSRVEVREWAFDWSSPSCP
jgi:hypothetical protein